MRVQVRHTEKLTHGGRASGYREKSWAFLLLTIVVLLEAAMEAIRKENMILC